MGALSYRGDISFLSSFTQGVQSWKNPLVLTFHVMFSWTIPCISRSLFLFKCILYCSTMVSFTIWALAYNRLLSSVISVHGVTLFCYTHQVCQKICIVSPIFWLNFTIINYLEENSITNFGEILFRDGIAKCKMRLCAFTSNASTAGPQNFFHLCWFLIPRGGAHTFEAHVA